MLINDSTSRRLLDLRSRSVVALFTAAWLLICTQAAAGPSSFGQTFKLDQATDFQDYKRVVREYIQKRKPRTAARACVLGLIADDRSKFAWVLWEQGGELILYENGATDLGLSRRRLNLNKDVVENESDLHGSTYLITKNWLEQLRIACLQHGTQVHIAPRESRTFVPHSPGQR
jgi:hypothetical protein